MRRPRHLREGSSIAIVAPSGPFQRQAFGEGVAGLRRLGLSIVRWPLEEPPRGLPYLAASDGGRAGALQEAMEDPAVEAIFFARGGYGVTRILGGLDLASLVEHPKVVMGFSDITPLLVGLVEAGLVAFHGPTVTQIGVMEEAELAALWDAVGPAARPPRLEGLEGLCPGRGSGPLVGGNLTLLASLVGTAHFPELRGRVLLLEEVGEAPYRIDRLLTQLLHSGALEGVSAVCVGQICGVPPHPSSRSLALEGRWREVVVDRLGALGVPIVAGLPLGHGPINRPLPLGVEAEVDAEEGAVVLREAGTIENQPGKVHT